MRLAKKNLPWGHDKLEGELLKLGFKVSCTTVRNVRDRYQIVPSPVCNGSPGWRQLMTPYLEQLLVYDFFTVETIRLKTLYVLFFIELGTRRFHLAGVKAHPNQKWVTQPARQLIWKLDAETSGLKILLHNNDCKFTKTFDAVFETEAFHGIHTPYHAPNQTPMENAGCDQFGKNAWI